MDWLPRAGAVGEAAIELAMAVDAAERGALDDAGGVELGAEGAHGADLG